jgi:hypothetical protein
MYLFPGPSASVGSARGLRRTRQLEDAIHGLHWSGIPFGITGYELPDQGVYRGTLV